MKKFLLIAGLVCSPLFGETVKDREGAVRKDKADMENDRRWIYNDWRKGFEVAAREKKPVLVVLRCVPCLACAGIDASVLTEPDLTPLLDKFVCVRVMNANDLDLSIFQFDYDLSFSALFFNADRTIYGRFGSWTHQKHSQDKNVSGFKAAMESALELHKGYPGNKALLAGKQGVESPFKTTTDIPELAKKYKRTLDWEGKVVQSCVHCHQIGDASRTVARNEKKLLSQDLIYPWPAPETIGLTLAGDAAARVEALTTGWPAERAGLQKGDEIKTLNGQALISSADVSWVLDKAPESGELKAVVSRDGSEKAMMIKLPVNWRMNSDISRRVATWPMRAMAFGGMFAEDLSDEERKKRGLGKDGMALFLKHVGEYGEHAMAKKAGFKKEDVIVAVGEMKRRMSESELIGTVLQQYPPGTKIPALVLRGGEKIELMMPVQ